MVVRYNETLLSISWSLAHDLRALPAQLMAMQRRKSIAQRHLTYNTHTHAAVHCARPYTCWPWLVCVYVHLNDDSDDSVNNNWLQCTHIDRPVHRSAGFCCVCVWVTVHGRTCSSRCRYSHDGHLCTLHTAPAQPVVAQMLSTLRLWTWYWIYSQLRTHTHSHSHIEQNREMCNVHIAHCIRFAISFLFLIQSHAEWENLWR